MRKVLIVVVIALVAGSALAAVANVSGAWRPGGPLVYRGGGHSDGVHLAASLPRDKTLYPKDVVPF
jgi:hypothetical protein